MFHFLYTLKHSSVPDEDYCRKRFGCMLFIICWFFFNLPFVKFLALSFKKLWRHQGFYSLVGRRWIWSLVFGSIGYIPFCRFFTSVVFKISATNVPDKGKFTKSLRMHDSYKELFFFIDIRYEKWWEILEKKKYTSFSMIQLRNTLS